MNETNCVGRIEKGATTKNKKHEDLAKGYIVDHLSRIAQELYIFRSFISYVSKGEGENYPFVDEEELLSEGRADVVTDITTRQ